MKVLHLATSLAESYGGPTRSVGALARAQAELGCDVVLLTPHQPADGPTLTPTAPRLQVEVVPPAELADRARAANPGVIHTHGLWSPSNRLAAALARQLRKPFVISPRGMLYPEALARKRWKKRLGWWLFQRRDLATAGLLHATSEEEADVCRRFGWKKPIVVAPNGVEIPDVSGVVKNPAGKRRLLFLSRIHRRKGLEGLLNAWAEVRPAGWELAIAGPDEEGDEARLRRYAEQLGVGDSVSWLGRIPTAQTAAAYASAELFVLPSDFENFGSAIAEALAAGTPVICNRGAPWSGVAANGCGWWIDQGQKPLTETLRTATQLPAGGLAAMGARGRAWMTDAFGWPSVGQTLLNAYAELTSEKLMAVRESH